MGAGNGRARDPNKGLAYRCFLVRCRLEEGAGRDGEPRWCFTVQQAEPDAARRSFASLKDVEAYLEADLGIGGISQVSRRKP